MQRQIHTIAEYQGISADVWTVFKKYFPDGADTTTFADDVHNLDEKYNFNPRTYEFMRKLLKVYFDELNELKGLRDEDKKKN